MFGIYHLEIIKGKHKYLFIKMAIITFCYTIKTLK